MGVDGRKAINVAPIPLFALRVATADLTPLGVTSFPDFIVL